MLKNIIKPQVVSNNVFEQTRYSLVWNINLVLCLAFVVLCSFFLVNDIASFYIFSVALLVPVACLVSLYKTKKYQLSYHILGIGGFLFPLFTLSNFHHLIHYGDLLWITVGVTIMFFGLGKVWGRVYMTFAFINVFLHINFFLNDNIKAIPNPFPRIDAIALSVEVILAMFIVFYIIGLFVKLHTNSEQQIVAINSNLKEQNNLISTQNKEKEVLIKEIHHRVKNNLQVVSSLLNLQSYQLENNELKGVLKEGQDRIQAMALLHKKLYETNDFTELNVKEYLEQLINQIVSSYNTKNTKTVININQINLDIDTALPLGLIVNELITNALKHGKKEQSEVSITLTSAINGAYELIVSDNGNGLPIDFKIEQATSLGLRLVKILTKQIRGTFHYEFNSGACFSIKFMDSQLRKQTA